MAKYYQYRVRRSVFLMLCFMLTYSCISYAESPYELLTSKQSKLGQLGFQSKWQSQWLHGKDHYLGGYWDASFSRNSSLSPYNSYNPVSSMQDFGITAMLRYQRNDGTGFYAEAGTGPQYQSFSYDLAGRPQGSRFAMNTSAGVGFVWKNGIDLGFKASYSTRGQGSDGNDSASAIGIGLRYRW